MFTEVTRVVNSQGCTNQFRSRPALRLRPEQAVTLIELLVVIAINGILAGLLLGAVSHARYMAKLANCKSNLRQFDAAIKIYSNEYDDSLPPWLSNLYPDYIRHSRMYICRSDPSKGTEGGKPPWQTGAEEQQFIGLDDFAGSDAASEDAEAASLMNPDIEANSYLYEFSCALCSWWSESTDDIINPGEKLTWRKVKEYEIRTIGAHTPRISCFWHTSGFFGNRDLVLRLGAETHHVYSSDTTADGWERQGL